MPRPDGNLKSYETSNVEKKQRKRMYLAAAVLAILIFICLLDLSIGGGIKFRKGHRGLHIWPRSVHIGDQAELVNNSGEIIVARSRYDYEEFYQYWSANDRMGMGSMMLAGYVFSVPNGTKALVIDEIYIAYRRLSIVRIRVLDGMYYGAEGWVSKERVSPLR